MASEASKLLDAEQAAATLEKALAGKAGPFTIADASTHSGLALRDAERGLHALVRNYRGHLRVTEEGELLFLFPHGFKKPWEVKSKLARAFGKVARVLEGAMRFVVRAWISIVLVGYAALFLALLVGLTFARSGNDSRRGDFGGFMIAHVFFRVLFDALFWTFHPFSPVAISVGQPGWASSHRGARQKEKGPAFYEKVNRFFFGPPAEAPDPRGHERAVLAEMRAQKGRIGLADVMRVTGMPRDEADPFMAKLMLDYDGSVEVSDAGGISYRFASVRKTAETDHIPRPAPVWANLERLPPLTGNAFGSNLLIALLNGFNLIVSLYAINQHMTLAKIGLLLSRVPLRAIHEEGTAIALGVVPLVFSLALFALPLARAALRPLKARVLRRENGRKSMLRAVLGGVRRGGVAEAPLKEAWRAGAGEEPDSKELTREVVRLGGDLEIADDGRTRYRFPDLEAEAAALEAEREAASAEEAAVGPVIFTSELDRPGRDA